MALTRMDTRKCLQSSTMFNAYLHRPKHIHTHTLWQRGMRTELILSGQKMSIQLKCVLYLFIHIHPVGFLGKETVIFIYLPTDSRSFDQISEIFGSHDRFSINENGC